MKVGIAGYGSLGSAVADFIMENEKKGFQLTGIFINDPVGEFVNLKGKDIPYMDLDTLIEQSDCIVEATTVEVMPNIVKQAVVKGKSVIPMSVGGFVFDENLEEFINKNKGSVYIPSGGIAGIDALLALKQIGLEFVNLVTIKSPKSLMGAPYFEKNPVDFENLEEPTVVFDGTAFEAIKAFPANTNLSITVSLAGLGLHKTRIKIIADKDTKLTTHSLMAGGNDCQFKIEVSGTPLEKNPRTSKFALNSLKALLYKCNSAIKIGT